MTAAEEWRRVPFAPDYEASTSGRVRSWRSGGDKPRILVAVPNNRKYLSVNLRDAEGRRLFRTLHSVVASAFHGLRPDGFDIRHLDGDRLNNAPSNLAYGTRAENYADMFLHGTHPMASRTHCKHGHEFTAENVRMETSSKGSRFRRCLTCERIGRAKRGAA